MRASNQFADATSGVVYVHSSPAAVCPHIEWALAATLDSRPDLTWTGQPADTGLLRTSVEWAGPVGTGGRLAEALKVWQMLRFEVTENPSEGVDGERFSYVPQLGLWRGSTSANGDVVIGEMRMRAILASADVTGEIHRALGTAWDEELEPYRAGDEGAEVTWLRRNVG
ncbi:MAG: DUF3145 domain-containing protein [Rhodococcus sp.]|uniref:DUF3145 domain-containing protein n=1 Tax=Rhodococcus TaxID=1827 RepID=UPI001691F08B|nr:MULTISPECIES: DUF3145 domain-containing protein [Rhodococcus]NLV78340.1 DUF3145 domain-containing protein [Rhodococcus sp. (in: high G+C Gram-positive bacteria)]